MNCSRSKSYKGEIKKEQKKIAKSQIDKPIKPRKYRFYSYGYDSFHVWIRRNDSQTYRMTEEIPNVIKELPEYKEMLKNYEKSLREEARQKVREEARDKYKEEMKNNHPKDSFHKSIQRSYRFEIRSKSVDKAMFESYQGIY